MFRNPRGAGHPIEFEGPAEPVMLAVTVCKFGGVKASSDMPSGNGRKDCATRFTLPSAPAVLGPQVGRTSACPLSAMKPAVPFAIKAASLAGPESGKYWGEST